MRTIFVVLVALVSAAAQSPPNVSAPPDEEIRRILVDRIDAQRRSVGIVVGVINLQGRRIVAYGRLSAGDDRPLNGDTVFEIGSITKAFTALLLAQMVQQGEVAFTDPAAKYLPPDAAMPERAGHVITLDDLTSHLSGLPQLPSNLVMSDPGNPYASYSVEQLYAFLAGYKLTRDIGSKYEYSNLGGGLLGHLLARRAGADYEALVKARICKPLGMADTTIELSSQQQARLATGHNKDLEPVPNWDLPTLAGAGALRSTANDMLTFLSAQLGYTETSLQPAIAATLAVRHPTGMPKIEIARGWHIFAGDGPEIIWHNGGTGGYRSFAGYRPDTGVGVVVLSSSAVTVDDLGRHLLDPSKPLMKPSIKRTETYVDPALFDSYIGLYQLAENFTLTVTRKDDGLFVQATGQPQVQIFPESPKQFFYKVVDAQITFETDSEGEGGTTRLILHQNGQDMPAARVE